MEAETTRPEAHAKGEQVAEKLLEIAQVTLPDAAVSKIKEQHQLFLSQLAERDRLTKIQEQHAGGEEAKVEDYPAAKENEDVFTLSAHVEGRLREFFSVADSFNEQEAQVLAEKLGISHGVVLDFFHRNRSQVEEILESARLKYTTKPKAQSKRNSTTTTPTEITPVDPQPVAEEPTQDDSQMDVDTSSGSESDQDSDSPPRKAAKLENRASAKKRERAPASKGGTVVGAKRHRQKSAASEKSGSEAETESLPEEPTISPEDSEKLRRLDGLKSEAGGLADTTAAGSMLLVMREESSFLVREALLGIILHTEGEMLLERLMGSNMIFCKVMETWINEGTKKKETGFLKQIVEVLGRVPLKSDHIKNSRLQTLVSRLSNKYNDRELNVSATELVTQFQRLRQGLPPQGQGKNRGLGTVLERLQSGEAKQKGKVFFLPSDALKRPTKKKPTMKQRPLTTSEIIEKQQRLRYLTQAGYSIAEAAGRSSEPSEGQQKADNKPERSGQASDLDDLPPEALEALRKHREEKKRKQELEKAKQAAAAQQHAATASRPTSNLSPKGFGRIVRCMREAPSDPNFYLQQQQAYAAARQVRLREEKAAAEQDSVRAASMRGRGNWVRPPMVDSAFDSLAFGEESTEARTLSQREMSISPVVPTPGMSPREPGLMPKVENAKVRELPFAPTNRQEFDDQRQKLLSKGVRKQELISLPGHATGIQSQQVHHPVQPHVSPQQASIPQPMSHSPVPAGHFHGQQQFTVQPIPAGVAGGYGHMSGQVQNLRLSSARGAHRPQGFGTTFGGRNPVRNPPHNRGRFGRGGGGGRQGSHSWQGGYPGSNVGRGRRGVNRGRSNRGGGRGNY